jgi:16S rRNA (cytosine1402-N4)-methyltransferase
VVNAYEHIPVLKYEIGEIFRPVMEQKEPVLVDATVGLGGHAKYMLNLYPHLKIIGIDRDSEAIDYVESNLSEFSERITLAHDTFDRLDEVLGVNKINSVSGFFFDLGLSSMQIDNPKRGFSWRNSDKLDMRMDQADPEDAHEYLNTVDQFQLTEIFRGNSEERYAPLIAKAIIKARAKQNIDTTAQLNEIIKKSIPKGKNPAPIIQRVYQALRIEINHEIPMLKFGLEKAVKYLTVGGIIAVISYHSLEDRLVKYYFKSLTNVPDSILGANLSEVEPNFLSINRNAKAIMPKIEEQEYNSRSHSARLRAVQRIH